MGKACLRLAELPGLLMKRRDSIASCSRTLVCGETSMASDIALLWRPGARYGLVCRPPVRGEGR